MDAEWKFSLGKQPKRTGSCLGDVFAGCVAIGCAVAFMLTLALGSANAQQSSGKERPEPGATGKAGTLPINPAKEASIRKLLEVTGAKQHAIDFGNEVGERLKDMLEKGFPRGGRVQEIGDTLVRKIAARLDSDDFIARLVPIYDQAFSEDDLKAINQFYESPAGRKWLDATPTVVEESSAVSEQWVNQLIPQIMAEIEDQFPELKQVPK